MSINFLHQTAYWRDPGEIILKHLKTTPTGLEQGEEIKRQKIYGLNIIQKRKISFWQILYRQFSSNSLIIILAIATFISYLLGERVSSYYIFSMILVSVGLGFWNEASALHTIEGLMKKISPTAFIIRHGEKLEVPVSHLTIGDIVFVSQGSIIPADIRFFEVNNLEVNQSVLTGESKTVFKTADALVNVPENAVNIDNIGYMGTSVESGSGKGVVIQIGKNTEFGKIAETTSFIRPETDFQKGLTRFGNLIIRVIIIMTIVIFLVNSVLGHSIFDSLLFSLAIAVGLTPELLPVIVTVSLAHGAGKLAKKHVVVKQLISIENLGNTDVLCTDKTGTLTEGKIEVVDFIDKTGQKNQDVLRLGLVCNSAILNHRVHGNSMDVALWQYAIKNKLSAGKEMHKLYEQEFDYNRKAMYTIVEKNGKRLIIVKGAPDNVIAICANITHKEALHKKLVDLNSEGLRMVALGIRELPEKEEYGWDDAKDLEFNGYITFLDTPKKSAREAIEKLHSLNVQTKIITGDNEIITGKICREVGLSHKHVLLGKEIEKMNDEELKEKAGKIDIFARVNPDQKMRIICALQKLGHTVGYMGDGINDLPSLHCADVGISVNTAVDVVKDAASVVLLSKGLDVIAEGIIEGRKTFNNTIKYILMATSSNFGNMFSAAGASFFLPFLPMTPVQILLTNSLYDISQLSIPSDNVDPESLLKPRHWNISFIKNYMLFFGPLSSIFDFATFFVMLQMFHAKGALFQTGWFIESIATQILVVFVIRTARTPFFFSRPGFWLSLTCLTMVAGGILIPFTPIAEHIGLIVPPMRYFGILIILISAYLFLVESIKNVFLKKHSL